MLHEKQIQKVNEPRKSAGLCSIHRATKSENYISNFLLVNRIDKTKITPMERGVQ